INAKKLENNNLMNVSISVISRDNIIKRRIESKKADISNNKWILDEPTVFNFDEKGNISVDQRKLMEFS